MEVVIFYQDQETPLTILIMAMKSSPVERKKLLTRPFKATNSTARRSDGIATNKSRQHRRIGLLNDQAHDRPTAKSRIERPEMIEFTGMRHLEIANRNLAPQPLPHTKTAPDWSKRLQPDTVELGTPVASPNGTPDAPDTTDSSSALRLARIASIREEIQQGVYETPGRIRATVDRVLDILA